MGGREIVAVAREVLSCARFDDFYKLPKARLWQIQCYCSKAIREKYGVKKFKYGLINKCFSEKELNLFFNGFRQSEFRERMAFRVMAVLGLRRHEVVNLRLGDWQSEQRKLRVTNFKAGGTVDFLPVPKVLALELQAYVEEWRNPIKYYEGWLFWSYTCSKDLDRHLTEKRLGQKFRTICDRVGLNDFYGVPNDARNWWFKRYVLKSGHRKLYRLSTHSLRRYAIKRFWLRNDRNDRLTQIFARHKNFNTTATYLHYGFDDLRRGIEKAASAAIG